MKSTIGKKLALAAAVVSALVTISVGLAGTSAAERLFSESFPDSRLDVARTLAAAVDGDEHRSFSSAAGAASEAYQRTWQLLRRVRAAGRNISGLYTLNLDPATGRLTYAVGAGLAPGSPVVDTPENLAHLRRIIEEGRDRVELLPRRDGSGTFPVAYGILRDGAGRPVGAVRIDLHGGRSSGSGRPPGGLRCA